MSCVVKKSRILLVPKLKQVTYFFDPPFPMENDSYLLVVV